jgi:glycosyltransferase involved in cell wall biosynthesis
MEKEVKILQLAPRYPFPPDDGGKIGIANIFKEFSAQCDKVHFVFLGNENHDLAPAHEEARKYGKVSWVQKDLGNSPKRLLMSVFDKKSNTLRKHSGNYVRYQLDRIIEEADFNIIHCDHTYMMENALYVREKTGCPIGLRVHNIEYMIWKRYINEFAFFNPGKFYIKSQAAKLFREEKIIFSEADICCAITELDKMNILDIAPDSKVIVASAGVNLDDWQVDNNIIRNQFEMIHATVYTWRHNVAAIKWFIDNVMPLIRASIPQSTLCLLGKEPPEWFNKYKSDGVNVLGYVPTVLEYLNKASIYIAPLFVGAGIRIKILEAMAMEMPVVASPVSAEGIEAGEENGLFIANDENEFSKIILKLMNEPELREISGKSARKCIAEKYQWKGSVSLMVREYKNLLGIKA